MPPRLTLVDESYQAPNSTSVEMADPTATADKEQMAAILEQVFQDIQSGEVSGLCLMAMYPERVDTALLGSCQEDIMLTIGAVDIFKARLLQYAIRD